MRIILCLPLIVLWFCSSASAYDQKDVLVAKKASKMVSPELQKGGTTRLRILTDECYEKLNSKSKMEAYLNCFAFHYTSYYLDRLAVEMWHFPPSIRADDVLYKINQHLPKKVKDPKMVNFIISDWLDLMTPR